MTHRRQLMFALAAASILATFTASPATAATPGPAPATPVFAIAMESNTVDHTGVITRERTIRTLPPAGLTPTSG